VSHVFDEIRQDYPDATDQEVAELARTEYPTLAQTLTEKAHRQALIRPQTTISLPTTNFKKTLVGKDWPCTEELCDLGTWLCTKKLCDLDTQSTVLLDFRLRGFVRWTGNHYYYVKVGEDEEQNGRTGVRLTTFNDDRVDSGWVSYDEDDCLDLGEAGRGVLNFFFELVKQSKIGSEGEDVVSPEISPPREPSGRSSRSPRRSRRDDADSDSDSASLESGEIPRSRGVEDLRRSPRRSRRRRDRSVSLASGKIPRSHIVKEMEAPSLVGAEPLEYSDPLFEVEY
jgi:hypothetical protein